MRKGISGYWPRNPYDYDHGLDPTLMPTRPEGAPLTPPSTLDQTPETIQDTQQAAQIAEGLYQLRKAADPNPELSPMLSPKGHETANENPQAGDHDKQVQEMIDPTPIPENKPRRKNITKIVYDRSPMKTPKKHEGQKSHSRPQTNIKNRLGPRRKNLKIRVWSPWVQGREPQNYVMWNKEYKQFLVDQLRQLDVQGFLGHPK